MKKIPTEKKCGACEKLLPDHEFFRECEICVDCLAAENNNKIYCSKCKKYRPVSHFCHLTKINTHKYRMRICTTCMSTGNMIASKERLRHNRNRKKCRVCGGPPTERDKVNNGMDDGKCADCWVGEYEDKLPAVTDFIKPGNAWDYINDQE